MFVYLIFLNIYAEEDIIMEPEKIVVGFKTWSYSRSRLKFKTHIVLLCFYNDVVLSFVPFGHFRGNSKRVSS